MTTGDNLMLYVAAYDDATAAADDFVLLQDADAVDELSLWQSLKKRKRIVFYCIGMSTAILMYGYDYVIVGSTASMPSFQ